MDTIKFLEEVKIIENKLRQKSNDKSKSLDFPVLVKQFKNTGEIDGQIATDLKKIWELRNRLYSSPTPSNNISNEARFLLASLISNPKLQ